MATFKILVPDAHFRDLDIERGVTGDRFTYEVFDEMDPFAIPESSWRGCDAVLMWHRMRITPEVADMLADRCRLIVRVGVGFDNVDIAACAARGIPVSNVPNYGTTEVADHALALLLYLVRGIGGYQNRLKSDLQKGFRAEDVPIVRRIRGTTFGAIGMGRIGTAIARRASGFDMKVIYYDPHVPEGHDLGVGFERVNSLELLLGRSDIVSLHVPLSDETRNIINAKRLSQMKPGSILINIARGGLVDVDAVEKALRSNMLAAAALDVLPKEPPSPAPALLLAWQNDEPWLAGRFAVTPHAAFYSQAGYVDMRTFSAEIIVDYFENGRLRNNVNPDWRKNAQHVPSAPI
jgi:D-3-phosphoglycerate dehydrogenase